MKYCFFVILAVITLVACNKKQPVSEHEYAQLSYQQTYCSDRWGIDSVDSITLNKLARYLDSIQLYLAGANIRQTSSPDLCKACTCKTGKTITISTLNSEALLSRYRQLGFR